MPPSALPSFTAYLFHSQPCLAPLTSLSRPTFLSFFLLSLSLSLSFSPDIRVRTPLSAPTSPPPPPPAPHPSKLRFLPASENARILQIAFCFGSFIIPFSSNIFPLVKSYYLRHSSALTATRLSKKKRQSETLVMEKK